MEQFKATYGDDLQLIYRHFPLITIHDKAQLSAEASESAGAQDKFWEMHDILFEKQNEWAAQAEDEALNTFVGYAQEIGVADIDQFTADLENGTYTNKISANYEAATGAGLTGTPTIVINGINYPSQDLGLGSDSIDLFINLILLQKKWLAEPEQVINLAKEYQATIKTEKGDIVIDLYPDTAPVNVNSFVFLAQQGWYDDNSFHRVIPGFVAQGGDPTGTGVGFPGYRCEDEVVASRTFDRAGLVALANSGPNTNGSQFFITYAPAENLNAGFTIIGEVVEGMDVAESITPRDPQSAPNPPAGDSIETIIVEEK